MNPYFSNIKNWTRVFVLLETLFLTDKRFYALFSMQIWECLRKLDLSKVKVTLMESSSSCSNLWSHYDDILWSSWLHEIPWNFVFFESFISVLFLGTYRILSLKFVFDINTLEKISNSKCFINVSDIVSINHSVYFTVFLRCVFIHSFVIFAQRLNICMIKNKTL